MAKAFSVRPAAQKVLIIAAVILFGLILIGIFVGPSEDQVGKAQAAAPEFIAMPQPDHFAMIIPEGSQPSNFEGMAKEHCDDRAFCKVFGWADKGRAARALPMSDREVDSIAFSYQINRSNDFEQLVFDCRRYPQQDPINCIAD